jgi:hypothetical protein
MSGSMSLILHAKFRRDVESDLKSRDQMSIDKSGTQAPSPSFFGCLLQTCVLQDTGVGVGARAVPLLRYNR